MLKQSKRATRFAMALGVVSAMVGASVSHGAVVTVSALDGSQPGFSYDSDSTAPAVTPTGFFAQGAPGNYNTVQISPAAIGLAGITLGDIQSISYGTEQLGGTIDWQAKMYTVKQPTQTTGWYGARMNYGLNSGTIHNTLQTTTVTGDASTGSTTDSVDTTSDNWLTDGTTSPTTLYIQPNQQAAYATFYGTAAGEQVAYFSFDAGAANGGGAYDTYLNDITITPTAASGFAPVTITTAVPEPASLGLLAAGGVALLGRRRRNAN